MEYQRKIKAEELEISAIRRNLKKHLSQIIGGFIFIYLMATPFLIIAVVIYIWLGF